VRPSVRLKPGGAASHLAKVSRDDLTNRYGLFLDFLDRTGRLIGVGAPELVTVANVDAYVAELKARVGAGTVWNSIYKLRRAAEILAPGLDLRWLVEIEKDASSELRPKNKADRLVLSDRLLQAGLTLIKDAECFDWIPVRRALAVRNGLMVALLALHPLHFRSAKRLSELMDDG
jgi:hypothetical protein